MSSCLSSSSKQSNNLSSIQHSILDNTPQTSRQHLRLENIRWCLYNPHTINISGNYSLLPIICHLPVLTGNYVFLIVLWCPLLSNIVPSADSEVWITIYALFHPLDLDLIALVANRHPELHFGNLSLTKVTSSTADQYNLSRSYSLTSFPCTGFSGSLITFGAKKIPYKKLSGTLLNDIYI